MYTDLEVFLDPSKLLDGDKTTGEPRLQPASRSLALTIVISKRPPLLEPSAISSNHSHNINNSCRILALCRYGHDNPKRAQGGSRGKCIQPEAKATRECGPNCPSRLSDYS
jgi:hypothetical protein